MMRSNDEFRKGNWSWDLNLFKGNSKILRIISRDEWFSLQVFKDCMISWCSSMCCEREGRRGKERSRNGRRVRREGLERRKEVNDLKSRYRIQLDIFSFLHSFFLSPNSRLKRDDVSSRSPQRKNLFFLVFFLVVCQSTLSWGTWRGEWRTEPKEQHTVRTTFVKNYVIILFYSNDCFIKECCWWIKSTILSKKWNWKKSLWSTFI